MPCLQNAQNRLKGEEQEKLHKSHEDVLLCGCKGCVCHSHTPVPPQVAAAGKGTHDKVRLCRTHIQISPAKPTPAQAKYG